MRKMKRFASLVLALVLSIGVFACGGDTLERTISFELNGGTSETTSITAQAGSEITAPKAPTKDSMVFDGWFRDKDFKEYYSFPSLMPNENITLYAKWISAGNPQIAFNTWGGSVVPSASYAAGADVTKPSDPTKAGFVFRGWYTDPDCTVEFDFKMPAQNTVVYAGWYDANTAINLMANLDDWTAGDKVTKTTNEGKVSFETQAGMGTYSPARHNTTKANLKEYDVLIVDLKVDETAGTANKLPLLVQIDGATRFQEQMELTKGDHKLMLELEEKNLTDGINAQTFDFFMDFGHSVDKAATYGYYNVVNDEIVANSYLGGSKITISSAKLYREIAEGVASYAIFYNVNGGSAIQTTFTTSGASITHPMTSRAGYHLEGWYTDAGLTTKFTATTMPSSNITLYAKWVENETVKISFVANGGSFVQPVESPKGMPIVSASFPKSTREGYIFDDWYMDSLFRTKFSYSTPLIATTLYARWKYEVKGDPEVEGDYIDLLEFDEEDWKKSSTTNTGIEWEKNDDGHLVIDVKEDKDSWDNIEVSFGKDIDMKTFPYLLVEFDGTAGKAADNADFRVLFKFEGTTATNPEKEHFRTITTGANKFESEINRKALTPSGTDQRLLIFPLAGINTKTGNPDADKTSTITIKTLKLVKGEEIFDDVDPKNEAAKVEISFDSNGGTFSSTGTSTTPSVKNHKGETISRDVFETPSRDGLEFAGWYVTVGSAKFSYLFDYFAPNANVKLTARWKYYNGILEDYQALTDHNLTVSGDRYNYSRTAAGLAISNKDTKDSWSSVVISFGKDESFKTATSFEFKFTGTAGLLADGTTPYRLRFKVGTKEFNQAGQDHDIVTGNNTWTANLEAGWLSDAGADQTITIFMLPGINVATGQANAGKSTEIVITSIKFVGADTKSYQFNDITAREADEITISLNSNGGSAVAPVSIDKGVAVHPSLLATPVREGFEFAGWYTSNTFTAEFNYVAPNANTTLYARWKYYTTAEDYDFLENVTIAPNAGKYTYTENQDGSLTVTTDTGKGDWDALVLTVPTGTNFKYTTQVIIEYKDYTITNSVTETTYGVIFKLETAGTTAKEIKHNLATGDQTATETVTSANLVDVDGQQTIRIMLLSGTTIGSTGISASITITSITFKNAIPNWVYDDVTPKPVA